MDIYRPQPEALSWWQRLNLGKVVYEKVAQGFSSGMGAMRLRRGRASEVSCAYECHNQITPSAAGRDGQASPDSSALLCHAACRLNTQFVCVCLFAYMCVCVRADGSAGLIFPLCGRRTLCSRCRVSDRLQVIILFPSLT